jgi:hypothetical protein
MHFIYSCEPGSPRVAMCRGHSLERGPGGVLDDPVSVDHLNQREEPPWFSHCIRDEHRVECLHPAPHVSMNLAITFRRVLKRHQNELILRLLRRRSDTAQRRDLHHFGAAFASWCCRADAREGRPAMNGGQPIGQRSGGTSPAASRTWRARPSISASLMSSPADSASLKAASPS